jgi:hypothetical protein
MKRQSLATGLVPELTGCAQRRSTASVVLVVAGEVVDVVVVTSGHPGFAGSTKSAPADRKF